MATKQSNPNRSPSRLTAALLETADDMRRVGIMDAATHDKITRRLTGNQTTVSKPNSEEGQHA